jgi:hypothetical protein
VAAMNATLPLQILPHDGAPEYQTPRNTKGVSRSRQRRRWTRIATHMRQFVPIEAVHERRWVERLLS